MDSLSKNKIRDKIAMIMRLYCEPIDIDRWLPQIYNDKVKFCAWMRLSWRAAKHYNERAAAEGLSFFVRRLGVCRICADGNLTGTYRFLLEGREVIDGKYQKTEYS